MLPLVLVDRGPIPGGGELRLMRRGDEFSIMIGGNELMNSRRFGSEQALATLSAARLRGRSASRILIGGLGMGFTLRAALAAFETDATFDVAELVPAVVAWARGPIAPLFGGSLSDRRVTIHETDVAAMIAASHDRYDGIVLDVDNGPAGLTREANHRLYGSPGLAAAYAALRPGGVLALWSATTDERFTRRFRETGFAVEEVRVRAGNGRGARHTIWVGTRSEATPAIATGGGGNRARASRNPR